MTSCMRAEFKQVDKLGPGNHSGTWAIWPLGFMAIHGKYSQTNID